MIYIYIYLYIYIYIVPPHSYIYIYTDMCILIGKYMYIYIYIFVCVLMYLCICMYEQTDYHNLRTKHEPSHKLLLRQLGACQQLPIPWPAHQRQLPFGLRLISAIHRLVPWHCEGKVCCSAPLGIRPGSATHETGTAEVTHSPKRFPEGQGNHPGRASIARLPHVGLPHPSTAS